MLAGDSKSHRQRGGAPEEFDSQDCMERPSMAAFPCGASCYLLCGSHRLCGGITGQVCVVEVMGKHERFWNLKHLG